MATNALSCTSPIFVVNNVANRAVAATSPCSVYIPRSSSSSSPKSKSKALVRAEAATGGNNETRLDVQHVTTGESAAKQTSAVDQRPRRTALEISPFGKCITS